MVVTAYDTGTAGFNIAVGVGKMMKDKYGTDVRVLPAGNDVARLAPLRAKRAAMSAMGSGTYFAQEGVFEFGTKEWGPQAAAARAVLGRLQRRLARRRQGYRREGDQGAEGQARRLRGRLAGAEPERARRSWPSATSSKGRQDRRVLELWRDVEGHDQQRRRRRVRHHHHRPGEGTRDLAARHRLAADAASRQGRLGAGEKVGSFFFPHVATCGAGITTDKPIELGNYPYPIFVSYGSLPADEVYAITKAMIADYDAYKDSAPGAAGLAAERQTKNWVVPFHPGAVEGAEGSRAMERRAGSPQQGLAQAPGSAGRGVDGIRQVQPAVGRQGVSRRLDEGARRGVDKGQTCRTASNNAASHRVKSKANTVSGETNVTFSER